MNPHSPMENPSSHPQAKSPYIPLLSSEKGLSTLLTKIFEKKEKLETSSLNKRWSRQDISKPKKETLNQYKQVKEYLPHFIAAVTKKLIALDEQKYTKQIQKLKELLAAHTDATPVYFLDLTARIEMIKESLVGILKKLDIDVLENLTLILVPVSFRNLKERIQIEKGLDEFSSSNEQTDMILSDLARRALLINEPALALKINDRMTTDLFKMMLLKNIVRHYSSREEVDEALKIIMSIPDKAAKMQLIKALSYSMGT